MSVLIERLKETQDALEQEEMKHEALDVSLTIELVEDLESLVERLNEELNSALLGADSERVQKERLGRELQLERKKNSGLQDRKSTLTKELAELRSEFREYARKYVELNKQEKKLLCLSVHTAFGLILAIHPSLRTEQEKDLIQNKDDLFGKLGGQWQLASDGCSDQCHGYPAVCPKCGQ